MFDTITPKLIGTLVCVALIFGAYAYGNHVGHLSGAASLSACKAARADSIADATKAAQLAQARADAATMAQQQAALTDAAHALAAREATLAAQRAKLADLTARLRLIPSSDKAAATWLGPLPLSIKRALNASGGVK